jgi:hypothetical protein
MSEVGFIVQEIRVVSDRLLSLPPEDSGARMVLMSRREELSTQAARRADDNDSDRPTEQLLSELEVLRRQRDAMRRQYRSPFRAAPVGGRSDAARGTARISHRIGRIADILVDRGVDPG